MKNSPSKIKNSYIHWPLLHYQKNSIDSIKLSLISIKIISRIVWLILRFIFVLIRCFTSGVPSSARNFKQYYTCVYMYFYNTYIYNMVYLHLVTFKSTLYLIGGQLMHYYQLNNIQMFKIMTYLYIRFFFTTFYA